MPRLLTGLAVLICAAAVWAENGATPSGEPVLDPPTLHSLGLYWIIKGDDNRNAQVSVEYRPAGAGNWLKALPLLRVGKGHQHGRHSANNKNKSALDTPEDAWIFAGSILMLKSDSEYELKLSLVDPDGSNTEKNLKARTNSEPRIAKDAPVFHVAPGTGGGGGTPDNPFKGLAAAQAKAKPGDVFVLRPGSYEGSFTVQKSGELGKPIVYRGSSEGEAILDGKNPKENIVYACGVHDVWFENLSLKNGLNAFKGHDSQRLVIRRCKISNVSAALFAVADGSKTSGFFLSDNLIEGSMPWPTTQEMYKQLPETRAIWLNGHGHEICYNRIHHFKDAIDTSPSSRTVSIDIHHNELSECFDDGVELDYSERNTRCFFNRLTNMFQGISVQPIFGGPVYIFRNVLYNVQVEPFKLHCSPSGALFFHNTVVRKGAPLWLLTGEKIFNCVHRNNLFIGTESYAYENEAPTDRCDFDYDGFGGFDKKLFLKWNGQRYFSVDEARAKAPVYKHAVIVDPNTLFSSGLKAPETDTKIYPTGLDLRLSAATSAIDSGELLPNIDDGFTGNGPDLGAYELGWQLPHYGPRPEGMDSDTALRSFEVPKAVAEVKKNGSAEKNTPAPKAAVPAVVIDTAPHRESLQKLLVSDAAKKNVKVTIVVWGRSESGLFKEADKSGPKMNVRGTDLPIRWKDVSDEDLARLALAVLETDGAALVHAGALAEAARVAALREKISEKLLSVSPEKARELDKLIGKAN